MPSAICTRRAIIPALANVMICLLLQRRAPTKLSELVDTFPATQRNTHAAASMRLGRFLRPVGAPVVIELEVRLRDQRDVEVEREVPVRRLREREDRAPVVHVALQADDVIRELVELEVVARGPLHRPAWRDVEREIAAERALSGTHVLRGAAGE